MHPPSLFSNYAIKVGQTAIDKRIGELQAAIADKNLPEMRRLVGEIETFEKRISEHKATMAREASAARGKGSPRTQGSRGGAGPYPRGALEPDQCSAAGASAAPAAQTTESTDTF